ncbi:MAG TPA: hypothetical protein VF020_22350 [Chthoniobacterales bacterium]
MTELIVNLKDLPPSSPQRPGVEQLVGALRVLPDPVTDWAAPNARRIIKRALFFGMMGLLDVGVLSRLFAFVKNGSKEARSLCQSR